MLKAKLLVNNVEIELNDFVEKFLSETIVGAVLSLRIEVYMMIKY